MDRNGSKIEEKEVYLKSAFLNGFAMSQSCNYSIDLSRLVIFIPTA